MTSLTDKWKKGKLPEGWYYVKGEDGQIIIAEYFAYCIDKETNEIEYDWTCGSEPEQILSRVPSYEEWKTILEENTKLKERNDSLNNRDINLCRIANGIRDENFALKSLLKECKGLFNRATVDGAEPNNAELIEILTKIDQVLGEE